MRLVPQECTPLARANPRQLHLWTENERRRRKELRRTGRATSPDLNCTALVVAAPLAHQASFRAVFSHLGFHGFRKCERDEHGVCKVLLESILLEWVDS